MPPVHAEREYLRTLDAALRHVFKHHVRRPHDSGHLLYGLWFLRPHTPGSVTIRTRSAADAAYVMALDSLDKTTQWKSDATASEPDVKM